MLGFFKSGNWNENNLNPLSRINWRASLVPAAAVIPAPIAYTKVVAVKKLVVGFLEMNLGPFLAECAPGISLPSSEGIYLSLI
jgi:hypothetical protein